MKQIKCEARIVKEYKSKKADVMWPEYMPTHLWAINPEAVKYPEVCDGDVTIEVYARAGMYFGEVELEIEDTCSRCNFPFYPGKRTISTSYDRLSINQLLDEIQ